MGRFLLAGQRKACQVKVHCHDVALPTSSPRMWLSGLLQRYRCQLDVNGRFTYYLNHLAPLCAALRLSRVTQCHQVVVGGVPKPSYSLLS